MWEKEAFISQTNLLADTPNFTTYVGAYLWLNYNTSILDHHKYLLKKKIYMP